MEVIRTDEAPSAVGAYEQGTVSNGRITTSGQIGINPETDSLVQSEFSREINQVLQNLIAVVEAGGGSRSSIVKTNVYLLDLKFYEELNESYQYFFNSPLPARSVVGVSELPGEARVEVEATAEVIT